MRQRLIFQKVKAFCDAQNYTISQIQDVTDIQVKNVLNLTNDEFQEYRAFVPGIKKLLIQDLQDKINIKILADLKAQIHTWLVERFPNYEVEENFSDKNDRRIIFYLDGRAE